MGFSILAIVENCNLPRKKVSAISGMFRFETTHFCATCLCAFQQEIPARGPVERGRRAPPVRRDSENTSWAGSWTAIISRRTPSSCSRGASRRTSPASKWKVPRRPLRGFLSKNGTRGAEVKRPSEFRGRLRCRGAAATLGTVADIKWLCTGVVAVEWSKYYVILTTRGENNLSEGCRPITLAQSRLWKASMDFFRH